MNLCGGHVNAVEYCTAMFGFPDMFDLVELYEQHRQQEAMTIDV